MYITLSEGYFRAANRGSIYLSRFLIKIQHPILNLKNKEKCFCGLSFLLFFRLQIYEAIADFFWQSASYVMF